MDIRQMERNAAGKLPAFTSIGAYTMIYHTADGMTLCADCASVEPDELELPVIGGTYDEGPTLQCDDCNADIASSYGDPDENDHAHGYVCKRCDGPSPVGIGYASSDAGAAEASAGVTACRCGYSRTAD